jgi:uncharacterized membrane protein YphA (DoxX/SURF4 family)
MQLFFGIWLFYAAINKLFLIGPANFVGFITADVDKTWSPHVLNVALAWLIMVSELVLGVLLVSGWRPRLVWTAAGLLMFLLTFGQTMLMKGDVGSNWLYLILAWTCAALSAPAKTHS